MYYLNLSQQTAQKHQSYVPITTIPAIQQGSFKKFQRSCEISWNGIFVEYSWNSSVCQMQHRHISSLSQWCLLKKRLDHFSLIMASSIKFGWVRPHLYVIFEYLTLYHLTQEMIASYFLRMLITHQWNPVQVQHLSITMLVT